MENLFESFWLIFSNFLNPNEWTFYVLTPGLRGRQNKLDWLWMGREEWKVISYQNKQHKKICGRVSVFKDILLMWIKHKKGKKQWICETPGITYIGPSNVYILLLSWQCILTYMLWFKSRIGLYNINKFTLRLIVQDTSYSLYLCDMAFWLVTLLWYSGKQKLCCA